MRERLPSLLTYCPVSKSQSSSSLAAKRESKLTSHSGDRVQCVRRKDLGRFDQVWQSLFLGFISFGVSQQRGCWVTRRWLIRALQRNGAHRTCTILKELSVSLRGYVLSEVRPEPIDGFPKRIQRWLRLCVDKDVLGGLAFTRFARALPKPDTNEVAESLVAHAELITDRRTVPEGVQDQIEQYVYSLTRGQFVGKSSHVTPPISNHAVGECSKMRGGYNTHINLCAQDPAFLGVYPVLDRGPRSSLTRALWRQADQDTGDSLSHYVTASRALPAARLVEKFVREDCQRVVHTATGIPEQGDKCRVITVPPASLFAAGDVCRQLTWKFVKQSDPRIFGSDEPAKAELSKMGLRRGEVYVSADLTKATDGFAHDAVRAVLRGLRRAGLDPHVVNCMSETLGVGTQLHYVKYKLDQLPPSKREQFVQRFEPVLGTDGKCVAVLVPMVRGILMGTPCSFTILTLLNGWCAKPLGLKTVICGDDVASACRPESVENYDRRVTIVGSGLHKRKTFIGHRGLLFCELYCLPEFKEDRCFEPVPLKSLAKDGDGVFDTKHFDTVIWRRMDRACRILWRDVRAKARRLGRWPVLPVELGGLGHPSKGKMGCVPGSVRNRLYTLIKEMTPTEKIPRWSPVPQPVSWSEYKNDSEIAWMLFESTIATASELEEASNSGDSHFVSYREARQFVSILTNEYYSAHGGRFHSLESRKIIEPARISYPVVSSLQYSAKAPMSMVAREYCDKLEAEGEFLSYTAVRQIRDRTRKSGWML